MPDLEPGHPATPSCAYLEAKSFCGLKITFACLKHCLSPYSPSVMMWNVVSKAARFSGRWTGMLFTLVWKSRWKMVVHFQFLDDWDNRLWKHVSLFGWENAESIGMPSAALEWPCCESCGSSSAEKPETSAGLQYTLHHYILVITGRRGSIYIHFFRSDSLKWNKHKQCVYALSGLLLHSLIYFAG